MNLAQELTNLVIQAQAHIPKDKLAVIVQTTEELKQSEFLKDSLNIGDRVKDFALPNLSGNAVEFNQLLATGPVVISFFRGTWCRFCNLELKALQDVLPEIQALGASLVAISPQTPDYYSMSTAQDSSLDFDVLSDVGNQVARNFGIVYQIPEPLRPIMQGLGADLPSANKDETFELPVPATYVIAPDGTVAYAFVDPDFTKRVEPTQIIAVLQELQAGN